MHLILIDGSGFLHRAFHSAPKNMCRSDGTPIGGINSFCSMLWRLIGKFQHATHMAVIGDAGGKTWRHHLDPQYKAHRPEKEDELKAQLDMVPGAVQAFGLPYVARAGVEADDIIATYVAMWDSGEPQLARKPSIISEPTLTRNPTKGSEPAARSNPYDDSEPFSPRNPPSISEPAPFRNPESASETRLVTIVSSDKDLMQLVSNRAIMFEPKDERFIRASEVVQKFGVEPRQIVDFLAMVGDSSDNIKGLPSIGEKTAAALLAAYGSIDGIYANFDKLNPRQERLFIEHEIQLALAVKLVTLERDVKGLPDPAGFVWQRDRDYRDLAVYCRSNGMKSLAERVEVDWHQ